MTYWITEPNNDENDAPLPYAEHTVGIVDDREGGIIAYTSTEHAPRILQALNLLERVPALHEAAKQAAERTGDYLEAGQAVEEELADYLTIEKEEVVKCPVCGEEGYATSQECTFCADQKIGFYAKKEES